MASIFPQVGDQKNPLDVIGMFRTKALDKPGNKVKIMPGTYLKNTTDLLEFTGGLTPTFNFPVTFPYYVLVGIDENGIIKLIYGTESAVPIAPKIPNNFLSSSYIFIKPNDGLNGGVISDDMIVDARELFKLGDRIIDHEDVTNRTALDSHPINSITDLTDTLDSKVDESQMATSLNNLSLLKADVEGTTEPVFTLNKDATGNVTELSKIVVERGSESNVEIGFNPAATNPTEEWYYITKDGNTGYLGVSSLDGYLNTALDDANLIDTGTRDFSALFSEIVTNGQGITTLTTNLATTDGNVSTNTTDIGTLTTNLATTDSNVATNVANISTNTTDISALTTNLATTDGNVSTNTSAISTLTTNLAITDGNVTTNTTDIGTLTTNLATTDSNVATNVANISTNTTDISALTTNLATTDGNVSTNTTNIATNTSAISTLTTNLATTDSNVSGLTTNLATTDGNVSTNTSNISTLTTNLSTHTHTNIQTPTTTSFNSSDGDRLLVDTGVTTTVVLPLTPTDGEEVIIIDKTRNFATVNLTLDRNGTNINGVAANSTLSVDGSRVSAIFTGDATHGWNVVTQ